MPTLVVADTTTLNAAIATANADTTNAAFTFTFAADVMLTGALTSPESAGDDQRHDRWRAGHTLNGADTYQGFQSVGAGTVAIQSLTLSHLTVTGAAGSAGVTGVNGMGGGGGGGWRSRRRGSALRGRAGDRVARQRQLRPRPRDRRCRRCRGRPLRNGWHRSRRRLDRGCGRSRRKRFDLWVWKLGRGVRRVRRRGWRLQRRRRGFDLHLWWRPQGHTHGGSRWRRRGWTVHPRCRGRRRRRRRRRWRWWRDLRTNRREAELGKRK